MSAGNSQMVRQSLAAVDEMLSKSRSNYVLCHFYLNGSDATKPHMRYGIIKLV